MRLWPLLLIGSLAGCAAAPPACLLAGQTPMQVVDLYFGRDIAGRAQVRDADWNDFAAREITPRFPDGFTVFAASGQWMNPRSGKIGREASWVVRVAVPPGGDVAARVEAVSDAYKRRFSQLAVGVVSVAACGRF